MSLAENADVRFGGQADIYRRLGRLKVKDASREWNGLAWIKLYDNDQSVVGDNHNTPKAIIWLWPQDVSEDPASDISLSFDH